MAILDYRFWGESAGGCSIYVIHGRIGHERDDEYDAPMDKDFLFEIHEDFLSMLVNLTSMSFPLRSYDDSRVYNPEEIWELSAKILHSAQFLLTVPEYPFRRVGSIYKNREKYPGNPDDPYEVKTDFVDTLMHWTSLLNNCALKRKQLLIGFI
jgi:hypothetical protein